MRKSLGLFAVLIALGGVNVYVFFFNRGTAPREVLKPALSDNGPKVPSSLDDDLVDPKLGLPSAAMANGQQGNKEMLRQAASDAVTPGRPKVVSPPSVSTGEASLHPALPVPLPRRSSPERSAAPATKPNRTGRTPASPIGTASTPGARQRQIIAKAPAKAPEKRRATASRPATSSPTARPRR